jgi:hypothetical protein
MRYISVGLLVASAVSPLLSACSDDGSGDTTTPTATAPTSPTSQPSGSMTNVTQPTDENPETSNESGGSNSIGTESNSNSNSDTDTAPTDPTAQTTQTDTSNISSDPSTSSTDPSGTDTTATTDPSGTDTTDTDTGSTTEPPPPPCVEADCVNMGEYCSADTGKCEPGCNDDSDCGGMTFCDTQEHTCKGCVIDGNCPLGTVCEAGTCVPGCNDMQQCQPGTACCSGDCYDLLTDPLHCGGCDPCPVPDNAAATCTNGTCGMGACEAGFYDCDKMAVNGCESSDTCECEPNMAIPCYTGPDGTAGKGICKMGTQTCNAQGTGYGACVGEVTPMSDDTCSNALDDDCNGVVDDNPDTDQDGYTKCGGDCCDSVGPVCQQPKLVNPGAFEVGGNNVDDDCDGVKDNPVAACDAGLASNSNTPTDYAKAIDLCQTTTENAQGPMKKWGVISATLTRADGVGAINGNARSIRNGFGTGGIVPQQNSNMAILSTGNAADQNDANPGYFDFQTGNDNGANSAAPADWLAANGNAFPNAPGCPGPGVNTAFNSAMLKIRIRVPTNALSFNVQMHFMSAEWPEYVCTSFNDLFVTLVDAPMSMGNPADKNIAIYTTPQNQKYPVGVNIAKAASGLFTECQNGQTGCIGTAFNYNGCSAGVGPLAGTGFQVTNDAGCTGNSTTGGGTGWLKMAGNVGPGQVMEIRFAIWDTGDGVWDSLVMLDDWVWSVQASQPGVMPN